MDVQIIGAGQNANVEAQVDASTLAVHTVLKPTEFKMQGQPAGGHFQISGMTGLLAAPITNTGELFSLRWADPAKLFILEKMVVQFSTATGFAATSQGCPVELIIGHASTANPSGGAGLAPSSVSNRSRNTMSPSAFVTSGAIRIATTATMTAATGQVLEAAPIASCTGADNRTLVSTPQMVLWDQTSAGDYPLILQQGDTLVVRTNTPAATGTAYMTVTLNWIEATDF